MWYFLIRFNGNSVTGFISPGHFTQQEALKDIKSRLIDAIKLKKELIKSESYNSYLYERDIFRLKGFLRSFKKPWRKTKQGEPVIKIQRINFSLSTNYWMSEIITQQHTCNILPYTTWDGNNPA